MIASSSSSSSLQLGRSESGERDQNGKKDSQNRSVVETQAGY
jgi:hypothetical protein